MVPADRDPDNERDTFVGWMTNHRGIVIKIVRSFAPDPTDADDLAQEIALALWRSVPSFRGESKPSTWIWRVALNRAVSWQRAGKDRHLDVHGAAIEPPAVERADDGLLVDRIYEAIRSLPAIDRSVVMLSLEGHRYAEIAEITGLTETNVGARLSRARTRLEQHLKEAQ